jgi:hypothetical protein
VQVCVDVRVFTEEQKTAVRVHCWIQSLNGGTPPVDSCFHYIQAVSPHFAKYRRSRPSDIYSLLLSLSHELCLRADSKFGEWLCKVGAAVVSDGLVLT